ncbi:LamG-like jellyroll fold domain-containing protein [Novipirellula caenicola]|uniref:LamG-like jellyroll fold domain-containing protein n=1 Tax=Novipirellula caenicola TaxID=1536901 RepID=A0ABP9VV72_9BACT
MNPSSPNSDSLRRLNALLPRLVDDQLSDEEAKELVAILQSSPEAQAHYLNYLQIHSELSAAWGVVDSVNPALLSEHFTTPDERPAASTIPSIPFAWTGTNAKLQGLVAFLVLVIGGLSLLLVMSLSGYLSGPVQQGVTPVTDKDDGASPLNVASVEDPNGPSNDAFTEGFVVAMAEPVAAVVVRSEGDFASQLSVGKRLTAGTLKLERGLVQMEFMSGAVVAIEGPAELQIHSKNAATLLSGRVSANVPPRARGFVLNSPKAAIVDLGTEFGVSVTPQGTSEVEVLSGEVELSLLGDDGNTLISQRVHEATRISVNQEKDLLQTITANPNELPKIVVFNDEAVPRTDEYAARIRRDSPLLYWRFEDGEDSPNTNNQVRNEMGPNHSAILRHGRNGRKDIQITNGYLRFQRSSSARYLASENAITGLNQGPYSIEFWMKPDDLQHATVLGVFPETRTDSRIFLNVFEIVTDTFMIHEPGALRFLHRTPPTASYETGTNAFTPGVCVPGQWHHVVAVKNTNAMEIYLNGRLARRVPLAEGKIDGPGDFHLIFGQLTAVADWRQFSGALDEIAVYSRALRPEEIERHFSAVFP